MISLIKKEAEVLRLFRLGHTTEEIAMMVDLKASGVVSYLSRIKSLFGFKRKKDLLDPGFTPVYEIRKREYVRLYASK